MLTCPPPIPPPALAAALSQLAPAEGAKTLSAYSQQFAAELSPSAPALSD